MLVALVVIAGYDLVARLPHPQTYEIDGDGMPVGPLTKAQIRDAFRLFFVNKQGEGEAFFEPLCHDAPLFAMAHALPAIVRVRRLVRQCTELTCNTGHLVSRGW